MEARRGQAACLTNNRGSLRIANRDRLRRLIECAATKNINVDPTFGPGCTRCSAGTFTDFKTGLATAAAAGPRRARSG